MADIRARNPEGNWKDLRASKGSILLTAGRLKVVSRTKSIVSGGNSEDVNDVLSESSSAGTAWLFNNVGFSGYITKALVTTEAEGQTDRFTLYLFSRVPTSNLNDDAANTAPDLADIAFYQGNIDFPALETLGTTDSNSVVTPSTVGNLPLAFTIDTAVDTLYGILVSRDGNTLTAGESVTVVLTIEEY